jgi:hypothetical protein
MVSHSPANHPKGNFMLIIKCRMVIRPTIVLHMLLNSIISLIQELFFQRRRKNQKMNRCRPDVSFNSLCLIIMVKNAVDYEVNCNVKCIGRTGGQQISQICFIS